MSVTPRILLLGAGRVAGPAISYLLGRGVPLTVACDDAERAEMLVRLSSCARSTGARVAHWSACDTVGLDSLLADATVAISLLPPQWHVGVAERCLASGVHLVTTSYLSPEMSALNGRALQTGVVLLNEMGLDPGIDHLSALALIEAQRAQGSNLLAFRSLCGGLPADRAANPWGYKLSWSPLGVLQAACKPARYREAGQLVALDAPAVYDRATTIDIAGIGQLESLANRDATPYAAHYGVDDIPTIQRATLRYPGWAAAIRALHTLGLLRSDLARQRRWDALLALRLPGDGSLAERARRAGFADGTISQLSWLGLFDPIPLEAETVIEALARQMERRMSYSAGEQDLVVLRNEVDVVSSRGRQERISATLVVRGDACGLSAMARTVGLTAALAAELLLDPQVARQLVGVRLPLVSQIYRPVLARLEKQGLGLAIETRAL